jgi:hypothetical protein
MKRKHFEIAEVSKIKEIEKWECKKSFYIQFTKPQSIDSDLMECIGFYVLEGDVFYYDSGADMFIYKGVGYYNLDKKFKFYDSEYFRQVVY